ncbi:hypothetical protein CXB51_031111 [Gossypium anomalum]|uniref:Uncharacterized protein n=1 Tax=Gossypium anomalum TaxID=47600 RepID=A0A8J6CNY2_9ROSI|nr:hypothetical protein CXB51_031111 [Gossypium anomalum]
MVNVFGVDREWNTPLPHYELLPDYGSFDALTHTHLSVRLTGGHSPPYTYLGCFVVGLVFKTWGQSRPIGEVSDDSSTLDKQQVVADNRAVKPGSEKQGKVRRSRNWRVRLIWVGQIMGFNIPSVPFTHSVDFGCKGDSIRIRGSLVAISEEPFKQPRPSNLLNIF